MDESTTIILVTVGVCLVGAVLGGLALHLVRMRALVWSIVVAALIPILAVSVSLLLSVRLMVVSAHDSSAVLLALACATVVGVVLSIVLGRRVASGSARLVVAMHDLGTASSTSPPSGGPQRLGSESAVTDAPGEIAVLAAELAATRIRLAEEQQRAAQLEAGRRQLVAFLSHDLRTPLAGLRALSEGLEDGVIDDEQGALRQLRSTVDRMTRLVSDLFELSNASDPTGHPAMPVSVSELVTDVAEQVRVLATPLGVEVTLDVPPDGEPLTVRADADQLERAVLNLGVNAVRHTPPGESIQLDARRRDDGAVLVEVSDRCGGIPAPDLPHVFDVGWRGTPARTISDATPGAGLGLAIARNIAQANGGQIAVRNVHGGCRFRIVLPAPPTSD